MSRIHENVKTLLDKRKIQKKKKSSVPECITVLPRTVTQLGMYGSRRQKYKSEFMPELLKTVLCLYPPFFYNVEVPENVNERDAYESHSTVKREDMKLWNCKLIQVGRTRLHQDTLKGGDCRTLQGHLFQCLNVLAVEASLVVSHFCCPLSCQ